MFPFWALLLFVVCYFIGAIPFGLFISRRAGVDISKQGSGNTGAANAARLLGLKVGLQVLALDAAKGVLAVMLAYFALLPGVLLNVTKVDGTQPTINFAQSVLGGKVTAKAALETLQKALEA